MSIDPITSPDNRWLKRVRRAAERHEDEILFEGPKQIDDALAQGWKPIVILVREGREMPAGCDPRKTLVVADRAFRSLGDTSTPQGLVALFERPEKPMGAVLEAKGPVVVLDGVQDPGNVGAIIRLAAAFEAAGVIALSGSGDPFSPRAVRGSAGTVLTIPIARASHGDFLAGCEHTPRSLFVAVPTGPSIEQGLPGDAIVILGSEGQGASKAIVEAATPFSIPISSRVESLNVATAAAVVLWELFRKDRP